MTTVYTRAAKGSALTWTEGDANITNLNNDKIEAVVDDTAPQLGGNLNVNGNSIVSTANGDITIAPNGTGITVIASDVEVGYGTSRAAITSAGNYALDLVTNGGTNSGVITVNPGANANIEITPNGTGKISLDGLLWPNADGTANYVLKTNGAGQLSWTAQTTDTNTTYAISAETATGGVNLRLTGSDATTDDVKLANGANITLTRTDANTITIAATDTSGVTVTDDTTTNATRYIVFEDVTSGSSTAVNVSSTKLTFNPSTGVVAATGFSGPINGTIGATTPATGAFTTVSASTTTTNGAVNATYSPSTTSGSAIQLTGGNTQGGSGFFDFLKVTNTGTGATNPNKTFRVNSSGALEIVNSAYSAVIGTISDAGALTMPSITSSGSLTFKDTRESPFSLGTTSGTIAPNAANGSVQTITLNGNLTLNAFTSPVSGQSLTLIINTNGTGRTLTSTMKFANGDKTLSTTNTTDIISVFYDGTNYWASLAKGFA